MYVVQEISRQCYFSNRPRPGPRILSDPGVYFPWLYLKYKNEIK